MATTCADQGGNRGQRAQEIENREGHLQELAIRWITERNFSHTELPGAFIEIAQLVASGDISEAQADYYRIEIDLKAREFEKKGLGLSWTDPTKVYASGSYRGVHADGMVREHVITQASSARAVSKVLDDAFQSLKVDLNSRTEKGTQLKELLKQNIGKDFPVIRMYPDMHDAADTSSNGPIHDIWADVLSQGGGEAVVRDALSVFWTTTGGFGGRLLTFVDSVAEFEKGLHQLEQECVSTVAKFVDRHGDGSLTRPDVYKAVTGPLSSLGLNPMKWSDEARAGHLKRLRNYVALVTCYKRRKELEPGLQSAALLERILTLKGELLDSYIQWFESAPALYTPDVVH